MKWFSRICWLGFVSAVTAAAAAPASGPGMVCELRPAPLSSPVEKGALDDFFGKIEAKDDGEVWGAEAFSDRAGAVLKVIARAMEDAALPPEELEAVVDGAFACGPLRPAVLRPVFGDASLLVRRGEVPGESLSGRGPDALRRALATWSAAYPPAAPVHTKFKIVGVEVSAGTASTRAFVQSSGETPEGIVQQSATWDCAWRFTREAAAPSLVSIRVSDYEEVQPAPAGAAAGPLFFDAAPAVLGDTPAWRDLLVYGLDHWFKQVDAGYQIPQGYHGVCVRDVDGDDREDVFLCQPAGIRDMLFKRQPDGTLQDRSADSGLDFLDNTRSALFVDLDNDGDADAAVTLGYSVILFENTGRGHFVKKTGVNMASWIMSMAAADYDNDGRLDLYFCGYSTRDSVRGGDLLANPVPYHDANNGAPNFLLHNDGSFQFTNATQSTGLDVNNRKFTNAAVWEDYDNDGDMDLYCVNDFGRKNLYRNDLILNGMRQRETRFTDMATEAGVHDLGAGMSGAWGDYNHDGLMDLYVSNMFSSAGRRIASQKTFKADDTPENRAGLLRLARGNSLFRNRGDGTFSDEGEPSATFLGRWAWASLFADLNNDSWEDIYVCNGFYTRPDPGDL